MHFRSEVAARLLSSSAAAATAARTQCGMHARRDWPIHEQTHKQINTCVTICFVNSIYFVEVQAPHKKPLIEHVTGKIEVTSNSM